MAGDFPVTILRANNVAGLFSGEGWVKVPYLADTKIHVTYQNIKVNTDHKLIDGYFETNYDAKGANIINLDPLFAQVGTLLGNVKNWIFDTTKTAQKVALINQYVDSIKAKNPNLPDSLFTVIKAGVDSLTLESKTITQYIDSVKNKNPALADSLVTQLKQSPDSAQQYPKTQYLASTSNDLGLMISTATHTSNYLSTNLENLNNEALFVAQGLIAIPINNNPTNPDGVAIGVTPNGKSIMMIAKIFTARVYSLDNPYVIYGFKVGNYYYEWAPNEDDYKIKDKADLMASTLSTNKQKVTLYLPDLSTCVVNSKQGIDWQYQEGESKDDLQNRLKLTYNSSSLPENKNPISSDFCATYLKLYQKQLALKQKAPKPEDIRPIIEMVKKANQNQLNSKLTYYYLKSHITFNYNGSFLFSQQNLWLVEGVLSELEVEYSNSNNPNDDEIDCKDLVEGTKVNEISGNQSYTITVGRKLTFYLPTKAEEQLLLKHLQTPIVNPKTIALFVNGYRKIDLVAVTKTLAKESEKPNTNNTILTSDAVDDGNPYWDGIDQDFIERLHPKNIYYADGHMSITTSNHKSIPLFGASYASCATNKFPFLNTTPNPEGFNVRREQGKLAGQNLLNLLRANNNINKDGQMITDTLDIICHSMGYAYAMGMIDKLKGYVPFGRIYIIAPEDAGAGGTDWSQFTEVWQYGSDPTQDGITKQDGVAPQVSALNLTPDRRAYIPDQSNGIPIPKNFLDSHKIDNYWWIFNKKETDAGYIKERK